MKVRIVVYITIQNQIVYLRGLRPAITVIDKDFSPILGLRNARPPACPGQSCAIVESAGVPSERPLTLSALVFERLNPSCGDFRSLVIGNRVAFACHERNALRTGQGKFCQSKHAIAFAIMLKPGLFGPTIEPGGMHTPAPKVSRFHHTRQQDESLFRCDPLAMTIDPSCETLVPGQACWPNRLCEQAYPTLNFLGNSSLLTRQPTAIFCSSKCPGDMILKTTKWIGRLAEDEKTTIVGGFHSAMEKSFLDILLGGRCRLIVCPARSLVRYRVPATLKPAMSEERLMVISSLSESVRSNSASSSLARNHLVADLASDVIVAHAAEGSRTEKFVLGLLAKRKSVVCLDPRCNTLLSAGAKLMA